MRHEVMMGMSKAEINQYAEACGIDVSGLRTKEEKVTEIEERRGRVADVRILGMTLAVPIRRLHDQRVADVLKRGEKLTDEAASAAMTLLLGEEQYEALIDHCTDDDGTVDVEAIGCAFVALMTNPDLKNY